MTKRVFPSLFCHLNKNACNGSFHILVRFVKDELMINEFSRPDALCQESVSGTFDNNPKVFEILTSNR